MPFWLFYTKPKRGNFSPNVTTDDVGERSGQMHPYVRPVLWGSPLAIMGVRLRVRHQSQSRAQGTKWYAALPELS